MAGLVEALLARRDALRSRAWQACSRQRTSACRFSTSAPIARAAREATSSRTSQSSIDSGRVHERPAGGARSRQAFADYCGAAQCVGVASGLDALRLALLAAGIERGRRGDRPGEHVRRDVRGGHAGGRRAGAGRRLARPTTTSTSTRPRPRSAPRTRFAPARPPLRPARRHARAPRARRAGTRSSIVEDACQAHGATRDGIARRHGRRRGRLQLLPGQEPRRVRRRRRARHRRRRARGARARAARARPAREVPPRARGLHGAARHDPGDRAARTSCRCSTAWNDERRAAAPVLRRARSRASATSSCRRSPDGSDPVWHLYVVRTRDRDALARLPRASAGSGRAATTRSRRTSRRRYASLGYRRGAFPVDRGARRASCLSLPIFPGITRRRSSRRVVAAIAAFFADGADAPANDAPLPPDRRRRVRRGRRRAARSRTSTAARSATRRGSARSSRSSAAPSIGARCKIQSHTFICDGVRSSDEVFVGHGVMFINDKSPARDDRRRRAADRGGLGAAADGRRATRVDRLGRGRPRRRPDRRRRARRRGRGRDEGRRAGGRGRGRPRPGHADRLAHDTPNCVDDGLDLGVVELRVEREAEDLVRQAARSSPGGPVASSPA